MASAELIFMCGIAAYIGKREAVGVLMEGLTRMEYRGYDSAGLAVVDAKGAELFRAKGRVAMLREKLGDTLHSQHVGIAHTRWATHGEPSERNAHPHADCTGSIFVVHNGIIENYASLKEQLQKDGHTFSSDTDTEVIAHLIEQYNQGDLALAVQKTLQMLKGAYGIAVVSSRYPDTVVVARFGSPLVIGLGKGECIVASDITAVLPITDKVMYLNDGEMGVFKADGYTITDFYNAPCTKKTEHVTWTIEAAQLNGFPHFMLKEIFEQPEALRNTMRGRMVVSEGTVKFGGLEAFEPRIRALKRLIIVGMGTARFTGLIGEYAFEELAGISTKVEFGSEFAYRSAAVDEYTGLIAVSQSGETADTLNAIKEAKRRGMLTLGIVNVVGSTMAREVDAGIYNHVGPEIAVASTKATTSEVLVLMMLAVYLGRMHGLSKSEGQRILREMQKLPLHAETILNNAKPIEALAQKYYQKSHFFFVGRKYNTGTAMEGALKLKECSYIHAEGCNAAELKHGPLSLIDRNFPSLVIAPTDSMYEKNKSHIQEIKARKGTVIALATEGNTELARIADDIIYIPQTLEMLTPALSFIAMQLFAYYIAVARGCDVDKPRNLAKSVTVE